MSAPSETPVFDCQAAQARASLFLDGRLRAEARRQVQDHLRSCGSCVRFFRQTTEVGRLARRLPVRPIPADLATNVRREVSYRRRSALERLGLGSHRVVATAAAAAIFVLVVGAFSAGYLTGRADRPAEPPAVVTAPPVQHVAPANFDPDRFARAARGLANDIELIHSVPAAERVPLVNAQLEYLDLDAQAVHILRTRARQPEPLRELARFVHGLAIAVADEAQVPEWDRLRADARRRGLSRLRMAATGKLRPRAARRSGDEVVLQVGGDLPAASREALAELLAFKDSFVEGRVDPSIRYAHAEGENRPGASFELLTGAVVVRTLSEAGRIEEARTVITRVTTWTHGATGAPSIAQVLKELFEAVESRR